MRNKIFRRPQFETEAVSGSKNIEFSHSFNSLKNSKNFLKKGVDI